MTQTRIHQDVVEGFRSWLDGELDGDSRFGGSSRHDREDHSTLATRWQSAENSHVWFEVAVRPLIPLVRVGILTDDRWKSEDLEEKIEESGDTMSEFVEMGFDEAGLTWVDPPVEHYREELKYFYFSTALELTSPQDLASPAIREQVWQMFEGYYHAFGPFLK